MNIITVPAVAGVSGLMNAHLGRILFLSPVDPSEGHLMPCDACWEEFPLTACGTAAPAARNLSTTHTITDCWMSTDVWESIRESPDHLVESATGRHSSVRSTWQKTAWKTFSFLAHNHGISDLTFVSKIYHPNKEIQALLNSWKGSLKRPKIVSHLHCPLHICLKKKDSVLS